MVSVHEDGACTIHYYEFEVKFVCNECGKEYEKGYQFMVMRCACICGDYFRICEECAPMFYRCDCGCGSNYKKCT